MSDVDVRFHEAWLGLVQPTEGLVVSVPVLVDAQCMERRPVAEHQRFVALTADVDGRRRVTDFDRVLGDTLGLTPDLFDRGDALPRELSYYSDETKAALRPTLALRHLSPPADAPASNLPDDSTVPSRAGRPYVALVWDLAAGNPAAAGLDLDAHETVTSAWSYAPADKLERLLRACRVPIGILSNREVIRLVYAPHGESTGSITFRIADLVSVGGRPIFDAFVMLLSAQRFFGVPPPQQLPSLLAESRKRQANVTNALAEQLLEALEILLGGFEAAGERDARSTLRAAIEEGGDHVYGGLLTVLLRLVFLLYAEDTALLPVESSLYVGHLSVGGLYAQLEQDQSLHRDTMARRFGAWARLVALFRAVYAGARHGDMHLPARRGDLFDPQRFPFLEGRLTGAGAPFDVAERAAVELPSVDDGTLFEVLRRLVYLDGQRLSYKALDVEQIGSVYEALMGYHVERLTSDGLCLRGERVWVSADRVLAEKPERRAALLIGELGVKKPDAAKVASALKSAGSEAEILDALMSLAVSDGRGRGARRGRFTQLVLQPGAERRRTSSHYTPRELSAPIVKKTLEPLLAAMGGEPSSESLLNLKICDPAMGSGAFLVEACRFLGDQVVAAWHREGKSGDAGEVHRARRLVAQKCLYGVDKNSFAVSLAKLSLWLLTLAKEQPFTFLDHALRHGDSLVGLSLEQIRGFHWQPKKQLEQCAREVDEAVARALDLRLEILRLAASDDPYDAREKELLLAEAEQAGSRARLIADLCVGAFFAADSDKARGKARDRRYDLLTAWLQSGSDEPPAELVAMQEQLHEQVPALHWPLEFPEVFHAERPDPLEDNVINRAASMDAFVGNPPFMGGSQISGELGAAYRDWLLVIHAGAHGNADYCAHFFRRADVLLGRHGTIGLIATNTIAQGDTRATALQCLVKSGLVIYDAMRSMPWPGAAAVAVSVVHLAKGALASRPPPRALDGMPVAIVNSRLRATEERPDPVALSANQNISFLGSKIYGQGFTLTPEERQRLMAKDARNGERIFPYLGGEEVNTSPTQSFDRYVISFGQMSLEEAERWPDLIAIVRDKVKPERDQNNREVRRRYWWRFGEVAPALYEAIRGFMRCLVISRHTKYPSLTFQPTDRVFSEATIVFAFDDDARFGVMQSRVHEVWARLLSSSLEDRLRYSPSDCFENFPFPTGERLGALEAIGERLYTVRAQFMSDTQQGLTVTYNLLKDPAVSEPRILELRALHQELDRQVLAAYEFVGIAVPPYLIASDDDRLALARFEDEVIDQLFKLNADCAVGEERLGLRNRGKRQKIDEAQLALDVPAPAGPLPPKGET